MARQIPSRRAGVSDPTRLSSLSAVTVAMRWRFTAHAFFMPSCSSKTTSDGTPRMVEGMGATVTEVK